MLVLHFSWLVSAWNERSPRSEFDQKALAADHELHNFERILCFREKSIIAYLFQLNFDQTIGRNRRPIFALSEAEN